jgi:bacillithiol biosynthesis cysteine-adding enzyme BshC
VTASIFDAYVSGGAQEFFPSSFRRGDDRLRAVRRVGRIAPAVLARLEAQNVAFGPSAARATHLRALADGAAAVVTGQQVGLFLGPLYTVYKAATAVRAARALADESGRPVVPVFWLQTEDHDLAEIAHCTLARAHGDPLKLEVPSAAHNHVSIAHVALPESIAECHAVLERELGGLPEARVHLDRLARHYRAGAGWAEAFAGVLAELFEPEGLLLIDPRDRVFAAEIRALHADALERATALGSLLIARRDALERASYEAVVHIRADSPLAFFHPEAVTGPRYRLARVGEEFSEIGGSRRHARHALRDALAGDPLCFSTSALLRPIVQDSLLPTAAYVGGPAEVAYYAQLAPLYAAFGMEMPLVLPRARFRVIEPAAARLLERYALEPAATELSEVALLKQLAARSGEAGLAPEALERELATGFEVVLAGALAKLPFAPGPLQSAIDKTRRTLETTSKKLSERYASVRAEHDAARVRDVRRLRAMLQPDGVPQERSYGLAYFAARYGERSFLEGVLAAVEPFEAARKELYL